MILRVFLALTLSGILALPAAAANFKAKNGMRVADNGDGSFAVIGPADFWARDYWCAASDYAARQLGQRNGDLLVVSRPYGRADKEVHFAPAPPGTVTAPFLALSDTMHLQNAGLKLFQAAQYCADRKLGRSG